MVNKQPTATVWRLRPRLRTRLSKLPFSGCWKQSNLDHGETTATATNMNLTRFLFERHMVFPLPKSGSMLLLRHRPN